MLIIIASYILAKNLHETWCKHFHSVNCIWICYPQNVGHFDQAAMRQEGDRQPYIFMVQFTNNCDLNEIYWQRNLMTKDNLTIWCSEQHALTPSQSACLYHKCAYNIYIYIYMTSSKRNDSSTASQISVHKHYLYYCFIKTLRPKQNGRHFRDDICKCIFLNESIWMSIEISLKFVPKGPINNIPALVQIMAWRRSGERPLYEPMPVCLLTHMCVTRPQWVMFRRPEIWKHWQGCTWWNWSIYTMPRFVEKYLLVKTRSSTS